MNEETNEEEVSEVTIKGDHEFQIWFNLFLAAYNKGGVEKKDLIKEANALFSAVVPYKRELDASKEEFMLAQKMANENYMKQLAAQKKSFQSARELKND